MRCRALAQPLCPPSPPLLPATKARYAQCLRARTPTPLCQPSPLRRDGDRRVQPPALEILSRWQEMRKMDFPSPRRQRVPLARARRLFTRTRLARSLPRRAVFNALFVLPPPAVRAKRAAAAAAAAAVAVVLPLLKRMLRSACAVCCR